MRYGGLGGVSSLHLIESALARPYSGYHRSIDRKAAAVLHGMVSNHGFVDGNKRTAWLLTEVLVERSGYELAMADDAPIDDLVVAVADRRMTFEDLVQWFRQRLRKRAP